MKLKYQFAIQKLEEDYVAVAVNEDAGKFSGMLRVNESGKVILEALQKDTTREEILAALKGSFAGDEAAMLAQIDRMTAQLRGAGLLAD